MKLNNQSHFSIISSLSSYSVLKELIDRLLKLSSSYGNDTWFADSVISNAPSRFRKEEIGFTRDFYKSETNSKLYPNLDFLEEVSDRLLECNGSEFIFRDNEEDEGQTLALQVHPYIFASYATAKKLNSGDCGFRDFVALAENITPFLCRNDNPQLNYADNHIHLSGGHDPSASIMYWCNNKTPERDFKRFPEIARLQYENSSFKPEQIVMLLQTSFNYLNKYILGVNDDDTRKFVQNISRIQNDTILLTFRLDSWDEIHPAAFANMNRGGQCQKSYSCAIDHYLERNYHSAYFAYLTSLFLLEQNSETTSSANIAIRIFLVCSNIIRSHIVQSSQTGLKYFTDFFSSKLIMKTSKDYVNHIYNNTALLKPNYIEGKVSPWIASLDGIKGEIFSYLRTTQKNRLSNPLFNDIPQELFYVPNDVIQKEKKEFLLHYIIHFTKSPDKTKITNKEQQIKPCRFEKKRYTIFEECKNIDKFINSSESHKVSLFDILLKGLSMNKDRNQFDIIYLLKNKKKFQNMNFDLSNLIIGLDAAGNECDTPPEVFAPVIRFLRSEDQKFRAVSFQSPSKVKHNKQLKILMHAGEDFNHIITGIRRIDETVRFCKMKRYDRIGHGLALGLKPETWFAAHKEVLLTREEYFDNLVWLWGICGDLSKEYQPALSFRNGYESQIIELGRELYNLTPISEEQSCGIKLQLGEFTVKDYYDAWKMRENCPIYFQNETIIKNMPQYKELVPYLNSKNKNKNAEQLFEYYHHRDNKKRDEVICLRHGDENSHNYNDKYYYINDAELDLYEAIQDFLITRYERKGLTIETCPSSNITIGGFEIKDHPIFRWYPLDETLLKKDEKYNRFNLRKGIIPCCINTDDPGIFPTTIQNEFKLLKNTAMEEHEFTETQAENWCEKLRQKGVNIFMRNWK